MSSSEEHSDSEPEVEEKEEKKSGGGFGFRAKKWFASKAAGTSAGRKVISAFLGDEGVALLHALKHSAIRFADKSTGKTMKKNIMKIVGKAKLAADQKNISAEDAQPLQEPMNSLALKLLRSLRDEPGEIDVQPISDDIKVVRGHAVTLMANHMKPKNVQKLESIFDFYGNPEYLNALFNNPDFEGERSALKYNMGSIVHTHLHELSVLAMERNKCAIKACPLLCAIPKDDFLGSDYCGRHHLEHVQGELKEPQLHNFTTPSSKRSQFFVNFLRSKEAENKETKDDNGKNVGLFHFNDVLVNYKRLRANVRASRAQVIARKYIRSNVIDMPEDMRKQINADLITGGNGTLHNVYNALHDHIQAQLQAFFDEFLTSDEFQAYRASITIPQELVDMADRRRSSLLQTAPPPAAESKTA